MVLKKKHHPTFNVPNFGAKKRSRVKARWRKQMGDDSKKRIKRSGYGETPGIGYRNDKRIRFLRPDGKSQVLVHNEKELNALEGKENIVAVFAHALSSRKRIAMQKVADAKKIRIANKVRA